MDKALCGRDRGGGAAAQTVVEADVDYGELVRYCNATGKKPDALVLIEFAAHRPPGEA